MKYVKFKFFQVDGFCSEMSFLKEGNNPVDDIPNEDASYMSIFLPNPYPFNKL